MPTVNMSDRDLAIVLAALRNAAQDTSGDWNLADAFPEEFGSARGPVTTGEIAALSEKLNWPERARRILAANGPLITFTCPHCGEENQEHRNATAAPVCYYCEEVLTWEEVLGEDADAA